MTKHLDLSLEEMVLVEFEELTNKIQVYQTFWRNKMLSYVGTANAIRIVAYYTSFIFLL
jgi:hypothetical protein